MPEIDLVSFVYTNPQYFNRSLYWMLDITTVYFILTELLEVTKNDNIVASNIITEFLVDRNHVPPNQS